VGNFTQKIIIYVSNSLSVTISNNSGSQTLDFGTLTDNEYIPFSISVGGASNFRVFLKSQNGGRSPQLVARSAKLTRAGTTHSDARPAVYYTVAVNGPLIDLVAPNTNVLAYTGTTTGPTRVSCYVNILPIVTNANNPDRVMPIPGTYTDTLTFSITTP
jgi:hypothetical protein